MLAKRVIPTMLVRGRTLVKGRRFAGDRSIGHAQQAASVHAMRGVDELLILDIGATAEGRGPDLDLVRALSAGCFIPITVGGGVKTIEDIDALLRAGADKVCIGAAALSGEWWNGSIVTRAADRFGKQAIAVTLDWHDGAMHTSQAIHRGSRIASDGDVPLGPGYFAGVLERLGAGEIIVQAVKRDGEMTGYDLDLIEQVANAVEVPVIASGGCSGYPDMLAAIKRGASGVAAGALFAFTDATPKGAALYLREHGVPVRL